MRDVVIVGPMDITGLSIAFRGYLKALVRHTEHAVRAVEVSSHDMLRNTSLMQDDWKVLEEHRDTNVSTEAVYLQVCQPSYYKPSSLGPNIGVTMYESDGYHHMKAQILNNALDKVIVPSQFNVGTFTKGGVTVPIQKVHLPLDTERFKDLEEIGTYEKVEQAKRGRFMFLTTASFQWRKGLDVLVAAYCEEFKKSDDVVLVIKSFMGRATPENIKYIKDSIEQIADRFGGKEERPAIIILGEHFSDDDMLKLLNTADAYVMLSRGEGWGLPYIESMALGKPVIGTAWSGNTEFMKDHNSYPVRITGLTPIQDRSLLSVEPFFQGQNMASPDIHEAKRLMREVYTNREEATKVGQIAREEVLEKYSLQQIAKQLSEVIENA